MRISLLAVAAALVVVGCSKQSSVDERVQSPPAGVAPIRGAIEDCSTRSEADFGAAFRDSGNLVVGPLALIGGAEYTPPGVVRRFRGQKFPLLVKAGHTVRIRIAQGARTVAGLGYGPLPQGEITLERAHPEVTFIACRRGEQSGSSADGPVTFWSGALVANEPHCVPLDIFVDGDPTPRRVAVELGVRGCDVL
jgi:hypothetical protein